MNEIRQSDRIVDRKIFQRSFGMLTEKEFCFYAEKYIDTVYRVAFSMLKDPHDADDITQETFMKLYMSNVSYQTEEHVKNWLIKVTVNGCKTYFRAKWRKHEDIDGYAESIGFESKEQSDLFQAVNSLDKKYAVVIHLHYYEGYSCREIGQLLGIPENTVSTRLRRARGKLKEILTEV